MSNRSMNAHGDRRYAPTSQTKTACVDVGRVFDSCSDRDCVEDLRVYFNSEAQCEIDNAACVRAKKAKVIGVNADLEELPFRDGCYSCKLTFYVEIRFGVYRHASEDCCTTVCGCTAFEKTVVLYGGEGSVQVFSGEYTSGCGCHLEMDSSAMPRCQVQVAEPVVLDTALVQACGCRCGGCCCSCERIPSYITNRFGGNLLEVTGGKTVMVTLGVFSIVQMIRDVQMLMPFLDYCVPCKECRCDEETPCELFKKMSFPLEEFFPKTCKEHHG